MAHRIGWSARALADVDAIASYIANDSSAYARSVARRIMTVVKILERFPFAGRKVPELDDENIRELLIYSYRVIYRVDEQNSHCRGCSRAARPRGSVIF